MSGLIESASGILAASEQRVEAAAQNVSNASTPGYKRQITFAETLMRTAPAQGNPSGIHDAPVQLHVTQDRAQGKLRETGRPLDLAIFGPGYVQLRDGDRIAYSRGGSFAIGPDGTLIDSSGRVLQQAGGGDLEPGSTSPQIMGDGSVIENGLPVAAIALFETDSPKGPFAPATMREATASVIRQGQLESANVVMSDEMITMMAATRQAESGARLVQFYDQLIGQAITTFSRSGK